MSMFGVPLAIVCWAGQNQCKSETEDKDHGKERNEAGGERQQKGSEGQQQGQQHQTDVQLWGLRKLCSGAELRLRPEPRLRAIFNPVMGTLLPLDLGSSRK